MNDVLERIRQLKKEKNAVILAHLYQRPEIQDLADFVGDSLDLSRKAKRTDAQVIVFCGVWFMAETAKIISPDKTVLLPEPDAGCPMADMVTPEDVLKLRASHPEAAVVCYVNSSAEVKAVSDICCTSSNAVKVVSSLKEEEIIFVPDKNLGHYVSRFVPGKRFVFHSGYCPTHNRIAISDMEKAKASRPEALVLVHPECRPEIVDMADFTGSTAQIIEYACRSTHDEFIIGTESGVLHKMQKLCPDKKFYAVRAMVCPNMKKTSVESVLSALTTFKHEMILDKEIIQKAAGSIDKMLAIH